MEKYCGKVCYLTKKDALERKRYLEHRYGKKHSLYYCYDCCAYHFTTHQSSSHLLSTHHPKKEYIGRLDGDVIEKIKRVLQEAVKDK